MSGRWIRWPWKAFIYPSEAEFDRMRSSDSLHDAALPIAVVHETGDVHVDGRCIMRIDKSQIDALRRGALVFRQRDPDKYEQFAAQHGAELRLVEIVAR